MTTDLVETGCSTLSDADLRVTAETTERRIKFCQEVRCIRKHQHGLRGKEHHRCDQNFTQISSGAGCFRVYRQVVAAVAADQCCFIIAISLLCFSVQTGVTQPLKPVEELTLLLVRESS